MDITVYQLLVDDVLRIIAENQYAFIVFVGIGILFGLVLAAHGNAAGRLFVFVVAMVALYRDVFIAELQTQQATEGQALYALFFIMGYLLALVVGVVVNRLSGIRESARQ